MTTYYVDLASGNDANAGTSPSPFLTVQHAFAGSLLNPGDIVEIKAGTYTVAGPILTLTNYARGTDMSYIVVRAAAGTTINTTNTPIIGYGSTRFLHFKDLKFNVASATVGAYGIYIDGRDIINGDGLGAAHLIVENCEIAGSGGDLDRSGIMIEGADYLQILDSTIHAVAANDLAGGGIIVRAPLSYDTLPGIHVRVERNFVYLIGSTAVTDGNHRDGILLDNWHTDEPFGGSLLTSRLIGDTLIANNIVINTAGRGIAVFKGGLTDSKVGIINNTVVAPFGIRLGGSVPQCGIGGYGMSEFDSITYFNNLVYGDGNRFNFEWLEWTVIVDAIVGARNWSYNGPNQFSPTTSEPPGWLYGTTDPLLVDPQDDATGDYAPQSMSPLVGAGFLTFNGWLAPVNDINGTTRTDVPTIGAIQINSGAGAIPVCDFTFDPETPGAGSQITFTDTSTNSPNSFQWDFGDGYSSLDANPIHIYIAGGDYIVTHTVSNEFGANTKVSSIPVAKRGV